MKLHIWQFELLTDGQQLNLLVSPDKTKKPDKTNCKELTKAHVNQMDFPNIGLHACHISVSKTMIGLQI